MNIRELLTKLSTPWLAVVGSMAILCTTLGCVDETVVIPAAPPVVLSGEDEADTDDVNVNVQTPGTIGDENARTDVDVHVTPPATPRTPVVTPPAGDSPMGDAEGGAGIGGAIEINPEGGAPEPQPSTDQDP